MEAVSKAVAPHPSAIQAEQLGTGHAVLAAKDALGQARAASDKSPGDILILYGDTPFISTATFERLLARRRAADRPAAVVLGMRPADPGEYGRLIADGEGRLEAIVEYRDATAAAAGDRPLQFRRHGGGARAALGAPGRGRQRQCEG